MGRARLGSLKTAMAQVSVGDRGHLGPDLLVIRSPGAAVCLWRTRAGRAQEPGLHRQPSQHSALRVCPVGGGGTTVRGMVTVVRRPRLPLLSLLLAWGRSL